jgi:hypothetical protein
MPLTRPKSAQVNFDVTNISDPLIRMNSGETGSADKDAGIVIERGDDTNVAIIYDESADQFAVINTSEVGTTSGNVNIASYANIRANEFHGDGSNLTGIGSSYTHPNHSGDVVSSGDGATTIQAGAVDIAMLSASGTASSSTFLRGDNSWVTPTDTNTTYSSSDFSLSGLSGTTVSSSDPATNSNPSAVGHLWVNSSSGETYVATNVTSNSNIWYNVGEGSGGVSVSSIDYLVIAGGGGGGFDNSGGGGAGGYRNSYNDEASGGGGTAEGSISNPSGSYTVTIGAGGSGETSVPTSRGDNGSDSVFGSITSTGGGGGGSDANNVAGSGSNGGSGGGGAQGGNSAPGGSGTANQGYDGGDGNDAPAGGGGGAGAVGADGGTGTGGVGVASTITGSSVYRGGGGGAGGSSASASGGNGGGGDGSNASGGGSYKAEHGTANTGGGGGGAGSSSAWGSNGGSGVVILRVQTAHYTGTTSGSPTVTTDGSYTIMTFTGSGSYTA